jgi:signal transduction histidine kinase
MNDQAKSREELLNELQVLRMDYDALKTSYEKDMNDLKNAMADIVKAKDKLAQSDKFKSEFMASLSHELRTPLNGILGISELLMESTISKKEQQDALQMINNGAIRMFAIINDLNSIAIIERGIMEPSISACNVNEKLDDIHDLFKYAAEQKGIRILVEKSLIAEESIIKSDNDKILYILKTLVNIAIIVTPAGSVNFGYKKSGNFLEFFVKDMGKGISEEVRRIIFEKFSEGEILITQNYELTGLGLAISKSYVEILGGKIRVESELGKGSAFYFTIPYNTAAETNH